MNSLLRWNPLTEMLELSNEMDRLFEDTLARRIWRPAVDLSENDDAFMVKTSLPGIDPDDINITLVDNVLTIEGERRHSRKQEGEVYHVREQSYGRFSRRINLPVAVDADKVEAEYTDGILTLRVPKAEQVKPRRIPVTVQGNGHKTVEGELAS